MARNAAQKAAQELHDASRLPFSPVVAHLQVSVLLKQDGTVSAHAGKMEPASKRMVFTRLADTTWDGSPQRAAARLLAKAALELLGDKESQLPLW